MSKTTSSTANRIETITSGSASNLQSFTSGEKTRSREEIPDLAGLKAKQKSTWEAGDFAQIARTIEDVAEDFMLRRQVTAGLRVLDAACGTGNLAVLAARAGGIVSGIDIASNLIAQARTRAAEEGFSIEYEEGDIEELPYAEERFDLAVSMFGVMFAPRPKRVVEELWRVTKPGGRIAMANWTPEGFIGKMFNVFKAHLPPPPAGVPSPMGWGEEDEVRARLRNGFTNVRLSQRAAIMRYPFPPAETVEFFRKYYGPTQRAFASLDAAGQDALRRDLVALQTARNISRNPQTTAVASGYLEIEAVRI